MAPAKKLTATARIRIRRPPAAVFVAFAEAEAMSQFWFTRRDDGLREGEPSTWYLGSGEDAFSFEVQVLAVDRPNRLVIQWVGQDGRPTQVSWTFEATAEGDTIVTIEESGFAGSRDDIVARALDSTGGFNQVIIAAKALVEHGVSLNVVADHV